MTPKQQKGKGGKRRRSWHHGPLEDRRFDEAIQMLDQNGCPTTDTRTQETGNKKEGQS